MTSKRKLQLLYNDSPFSVSWYKGTPWDSIESLVKRVCSLDEDDKVVLLDAEDEEPVAFSSALPSDVRFKVTLATPQTTKGVSTLKESTTTTKHSMTRSTPSSGGGSRLAPSSPISKQDDTQLLMSLGSSDEAFDALFAEVNTEATETKPETTTKAPKETEEKTKPASSSTPMAAYPLLPPTTPSLSTVDPQRFRCTTLKEALSGHCPPVRWGHRACCMPDGKMIVYGGDGVGSKTLDDVWIFDPTTGLWSCPSISNERVCRAWHSATYLPETNALLVFGGERVPDAKSKPEVVSDVMLLDTSIMIWYPPHMTGACPRPRTGHSATLLEDKVVIFGGWRGRKGDNGRVHVMNTADWEWSEPKVRGKGPKPRTYHSATEISNNRILFFGGNDQDDVFNDVHVLVYDKNHSSWSWKTPVIVGDGPAPRTGHTAVRVSESQVFVTGGWDPNDEEDVIRFADAYILDTESWTWTRLRGEVPGRVGATAVLNNDQSITIFGGASEHELLNNDILTVQFGK